MGLELRNKYNALGHKLRFPPEIDLNTGEEVVLIEFVSPTK